MSSSGLDQAEKMWGGGWLERVRQLGIEGKGMQKIHKVDWEWSGIRKGKRLTSFSLLLRCDKTVFSFFFTKPNAVNLYLV